MNPSKVLCLVACFLATTWANPIDIHSKELKPSNWLTIGELEDTPSLDEITLEKLESMPVEKGAKLIRKLYHISQINNQLQPDYVPSPTNVPVYIIKNNGKKETATLSDFVAMAKQDTSFGEEEVTIFITGLPSKTETVKKANRKLIQAYVERYNHRQQKPQNTKNSEEHTGNPTSSEETSSEWNKQKPSSGNLIVIDLGQSLNNLKGAVMLDVDETGAMIGKALVKLTTECDVPQAIIHIVAQGVGAHVAGAAGNEYTRLTGHRLRRITALNPAKIWARNPKILTGLARGDADFVDAIHTSVYGMGTLNRVGDIDFYPNGPSVTVPGAENIVEAAMRATRYYAESVIPGNERNFPAVEANSLKQYKNNDGFGRRAFMGISTDFDLRGDYILQVNEKSPFGKRATVQKHHHGVHEARHQDEE